MVPSTTLGRILRSLDFPITSQIVNTDNLLQMYLPLSPGLDNVIRKRQRALPVTRRLGSSQIFQDGTRISIRTAALVGIYRHVQPLFPAARVRLRQRHRGANPGVVGFARILNMY